jgi:hypothetical protein
MKIKRAGDFDSVRATDLVCGRQSQSYGHGRICTASHCGTHLSVYNPTNHCSIDEQVS